MARLLACVLMVLLPLQSLWGVASRYCAHEVPAVQASHLGHHAHQPHAPEDVTPASERSLAQTGDLAPGPATAGQMPADAAQAYQLDADCHDCHGLPSLGLPAWERASGLVLPRHPRPLSPALAWRSAPSALPERPQWG